MGKVGTLSSVSCNHEQSNKENMHGVKNCSVTQLLLDLFLSPCLCMASSDKPLVKGEDVCSSPRYNWVSELFIHGSQLTVPPYTPTMDSWFLLGKTCLSFFDIFKITFWLC